MSFPIPYTRSHKNIEPVIAHTFRPAFYLRGKVTHLTLDGQIQAIHSMHTHPLRPRDDSGDAQILANWLIQSLPLETVRAFLGSFGDNESNLTEDLEQLALLAGLTAADAEEWLNEKEVLRPGEKYSPYSLVR